MHNKNKENRETETQKKEKMWCENVKKLKKTRKGTVLLEVNEKYLRNDIGCGCIGCNECQYTKPFFATLIKNKPIIIPDYDMMVNQIDLIINPHFLSKINLVILASILVDIRRNHYKIYQKIEKDLIGIQNARGNVYVFGNQFHRYINLFV